MLPDLSAVRGKRVLITGHTGFKGAWLAFWLKELGARVRAIALRPEYQGSLFERLQLQNSIQSEFTDIRDYSNVRRAFSEFQPEYVFHLAAQALVIRSYDDPKLTFDTNIGGSVNVLEAVRVTKSVRSVIYVTSDKCYLNKEWVWGYRENDELGGHDPYSASKAAAELVFSSYRDSFFRNRENLGIASVRAGNVIGGGDRSTNRIVPDCIRALEQGVPIVLRNPSATRPWQHVLEPLSGYLALAIRLWDEPKSFSGSWNFGPDSYAVHSVREVAEALVSSWGAGQIDCPQTQAGLHEAGLLQLNIDKAKQQLHWRPRWKFARGVRETAEWYMRAGRGESAEEVTRSQIQAYLDTESHL